MVPDIQGVAIEAMIGQGGMATVWKGRQLTLDRPVAVKVLHAQWRDDPADVERFQAEARSAAKLKHASIIQVHDANFVEGQYYIVMEYVDGYTVGDWLRRKGKLTQEDALLIAECVADGLAYAWQNERIIHCDIKPDNVMVDRDGTLKIADLGLSRTIDLLRPASGTEDEIMGTPAYMSPEQAAGVSDLDCRADIYSLGCMLYHILTGQLPFEGCDVDTTLEQQASGQVPDVYDVASGVSKPMCALLQKMMAKDRELRQADWLEVLADVASVRQHCLPRRVPASEASTMACSVRRRGYVESRAPSALDALLRKGSRFSRYVLVGLLGGMVILLGVLGVVLQRGCAPRNRAATVTVPAAPAAAPQAPAEVPPLPVATDKAVAHRHYEESRGWLDRHPADYDGALQALESFVERYPESEYAVPARRKMGELVEQKRRVLGQVVASLQKQALAAEARGDYAGAQSIWRTYAGPWSQETQTRRAEQAALVGQRQAAHAAEQVAAEAARQAQVRSMWQEFSKVLLDQGGHEALRRLQAFLGNTALAEGHRQPFETMQAMLIEVTELDHRVLESFAREQGQDVGVSLRTGLLPMRILAVDFRTATVAAEQTFLVLGHRASRNLRFSIRDLAEEEYAARIGDDSQRHLALVQLQERWSQMTPAEWLESLEGLPEPVPEVLMDEMRLRRSAQQETAARSFLLEGLRRLNVPVESEGTYAEWAQVFEHARARGMVLPASTASLARTFADAYAGTQVALDAVALLESLQGAAAPAPPGRRDLQEGGGAHHEADAALRRALEAANPGLLSTDTRLLRVPGTGALVRLEVVSSVLASMEPLAHWAGLKELVFAGVPPGHFRRNGPIAPLSDIAPLRGHALTVLHINNTSVKNLSPLEGMPLVEINASYTPVSDLSALHAAPLEVVLLRGTAVRDVSIVRGKPLRHVDVSETSVFDFRPLIGPQLARFEAADSQLRDISLLQGAPVRHLNLSRSGVYDFGPLRGLPLEHLELDKTQIKDLSVLQGKALRYLSCRETALADIRVLAGMPLQNLYLGKTAVSDFEVLATLPLQDLDLSHTRIVDLSPLAQLPLRSLNLSHTKVRDLRPLSDVPLRSLHLGGVAIDNLAPLAGMPIERLSLDHADHPRVRRVLVQMPRLRIVNGVEWFR